MLLLCWSNNTSVRLTNKVLYTLGKLMIPPRRGISFVHALLDYGPTAISGEEETVVIDLIAILDK